MDKDLIQKWLLNTILIEDGGELGTGFLVRRMLDANKGKTFLITNKHVIKKNTRDKKIVLHLNVMINNNIEKYQMDYIIPDIEKAIRYHPENEVDVTALDVSVILNDLPLAHSILDYSMFVNQSHFDSSHVSIGDDILVIGYPLGLRHRNQNYPLIRKGIISTKIGEMISITENGRERIIRGFLIDGGASPGSSGSPVIHNSSYIKSTNQGITIGGDTTPFLLGIVSESRNSIITTSIGDYPTNSGLVIVYDAATIMETIELFF